jgi:hypothetical protein
MRILENIKKRVEWVRRVIEINNGSDGEKM